MVFLRRFIIQSVNFLHPIELNKLLDSQPNRRWPPRLKILRRSFQVATSLRGTFFMLKVVYKALLTRTRFQVQLADASTAECACKSHVKCFVMKLSYAGEAPLRYPGDTFQSLARFDPMEG